MQDPSETGFGKPNIFSTMLENHRRNNIFASFQAHPPSAYQEPTYPSYPSFGDTYNSINPPPPPPICTPRHSRIFSNSYSKSRPTFNNCTDPRTQRNEKILDGNLYRLVSYCVFFVLALYKAYDLVRQKILYPPQGASFATDLFKLILLVFLCHISKPK